MRFAFLITARCNAACTHCTVNSGPSKTATLPSAELFSLMEDAAELWRKERFPGEALELCISGGEPFLDFDRLVEIIAHGTELGARMTCTTNGFWASSEDKARDELGALRRAGLSTLAVSTSRFHLRYVRRERVQRALRLARQAGIATALKCAITSREREEPDGLVAWARSQAVDKLEIFAVAPYLREGAVLPESDYIRRAGLPRGRCPAPTIAIREDGRACTCCMPGGFAELLALGNVFDTGLGTIHDRFYLGDVQQTLRQRGPIHFARAIIAQGQGQLLRDRYESVCDLCAHIAADARMSAIAKSAARKFALGQWRAELRNLERGAPPGPVTQLQDSNITGG